LVEAPALRLERQISVLDGFAERLVRDGWPLRLVAAVAQLDGGGQIGETLVADIRHAVGMTEEPKGPAASPPVISVMLIVADADVAVAWYRTALGATELWNLGGVAGLEIGGAAFFLHEVNPDNPAEASPGQAGVTSTRIEVFVDDPDGFVERAVTSGATGGAAVEDHHVPWGRHRQGGFTDPFGHQWSVGDPSPLGRHP
jgi:uncharacterized glyoxalase superfamily protein PhnB